MLFNSQNVEMEIAAFLLCYLEPGLPITFERYPSHPLGTARIGVPRGLWGALVLTQRRPCAIAPIYPFGCAERKEAAVCVRHTA